MKCSICGGQRKECLGVAPDGVPYKYWHCMICGEDLLDMRQLGEVAAAYRTIKRYHVKLSKWGLSIGLRIPKELAKKYKLKDSSHVTIIPEEQGLRILAQ